METNKIKISSIVESQLPAFVREEYPLVSELLTEYYRSLESKGSSYDILQNIDQYLKVNNLANLIETTTTISDVTFVSDSINVESTNGFPKTYGIIQIDNEIILYKSKTQTTFNECVRGFSGIKEYSIGNSEDFLFSSTEIQEHPTNAKVLNLSALFLKEFFNKIKKQIGYGFDDRELNSNVNQNLFLKQSKDFYTSKGTDRSFEILFRVLYGKDVEVILPRTYLIEPSNAQYRVTKNFVVEPIEGDIENLLNKTIFQDQYKNIQKSFGTITDIQKIVDGNNEYYTLILDYDFDKDSIVSGSIFGDLKIHPKTTILEDLQISSDNIVVDSTIGFPEFGQLEIKTENSSLIVKYNGKTINQFLNCSGINQFVPSNSNISLNTFTYGYDSTGNLIKFRITGVVEDIQLPVNSKYYEKGDVAKLLTLGYNKNYLVDNNWVFNTSVKCEVKSFTSDGEFKYTIETYDENGVYEGDSIEIEYINSSTRTREISIIDGSNVKIPTGSIPGKIFQIQTSGFDISSIFYIRRIISKFSNKFVSDVLNVYRDFKSNTVYTVSSSLPSYGLGIEENVEDFKITLNGSFSGEILKLVNDGQDHGFLTGDSIVYSPEDESSPNNRFDIQSGIYFIKRESPTEIKLARSRSDIKFERFVSIGSTIVTNSIISLTKFAKKNNIPSELDSQKLVKLIKSPENNESKYETLYGTTGILINGVEILNYKSDDYIYHGAIKSVDVISPGKNYDVINPPKLEISSASSGLSSALGYCGVEGFLQKIDIIDSGFDYIDVPIVTITGGGGQGATALAKMIDYEHYVDFNPSTSNPRFNLVGLGSTNILGFSTYHKFRDNESVVYSPGENPIVSGLTTDAKYYVKVLDEYTIRLHKTLSDSLVNINPINLTSYGSGNHRFKSTTIKKKIGSILVTNQGSGYKSKKISIPSSGINTANDTINVYDNPYNSGDIIYYYGGDSNVSGLNTGKYIATRIDNKSFKLSNIGIGSTAVDFYYKTKQYIDFKSTGSGNHIFDYEPISVDISGKVGISTISQIDVNAIVQPIFRGKVVSTFIYDGGVGYGSSEIINYNKQPEYNLNSGSGAILNPVVSNGKIISVVITKNGTDYNSPPDLIIKGFGIGASLVPIVQNGQIVDVKVISGGVGYEQKNTTVEVSSAGNGCKLNFNPQIWTVNKFERLRINSKLSSNDSVVFVGNDKNYGLQYTHLYSPRSLRKKIFAKNIEEGNAIYRNDYRNDFETKKYHSPLLGWAYDGNPIYGPYGYDSPTNNSVRLITSGYSDPIDTQKNRPSKNIFPAGYFVEDYEFTNSGDLDEHNGRFCVTPEFPNGTYAYFMTLESSLETSGFFIGDKKPRFPYIIGNSFKSKPIDFNFNKINQDTFDFSDNIVRNTKPYNTLSKKSIYEPFTKVKNLDLQDSKVESINKGSIDSIQIISGGKNYSVSDRVVFDNQNTGGVSASAKVDYIKGKTITGISQTTTKILNVEFYPSFETNKIIAFSTSPHGLSNRDLVFVDSLSNYDKTLEESFNVEVRPSNFVLTLDIGDTSVTGLTTYFYISGLLEYPFIRENDILSINSEKIKVLNIDRDSSRIRVIREQDSTVSAAHSASTLLYEDPRKFSINLRDRARNQNYKLNRELYFDPIESLGIGTYVGFGHTIVFSNPGVGITSIIIPQKSILLRNHGLNTGDQVKYRTNSGIGISVSDDGISNFPLTDGSDLYVAKISNDLIGISTVKVGLGTTGSFVGISQTGSTLFLTYPGTGDHHSFQTKFDTLSKANIVKNTITVSTASTHSLKVGDNINLNVLSGLTTTIVLKYDDYNRRLIANPREFSSIDIENNLITIKNHKYSTGQKLIHTSSSSADGLEDHGIYYAIVYDSDRVKLAKSYYDSLNQYSINIGTSSFGTLSEVNPKISIIKNQRVVIDLSDSSLSQPFGIGRTAAFDFELYTNSNFSNKYFPIDNNGLSKILKFGVIGVSASARVEFTVDKDFPSSIWYGLEPRKNLNLLEIKSQYVIDKEVIENNKISFTESVLNGQKSIVGFGSNTFSFNNEFNYESNVYTQSDASFSYYTNSTNEVGEIESLRITSSGMRYERLPSISTVSSLTGSGAILIPKSETIGRINSMNIIDIGHNYFIDNTIKPTIKYATVLRIIPLSRLESIQVISPGLNYNTNPDLVVIDGFTNKIVSDIVLEYDMTSSKVNIIKNTTGLYNTTPKVIAVNNSNGLGISSVQYESSSKVVRAYLTKQFSDPSDFPFTVGENILIEGVSVVEKNRKGYNSKNYDYSLFSIVGVNTSLGGSNAYVEYSLEGKLFDITPGTFDFINSSGQITPERFLPTFKITLSKNSFIIGEKVSSGSESVGKVLKFDEKNEFLTLETKDQFFVDSLVVGNTSKSQAYIKEIFENEDFCKIGASSIVKNGWNKETGFLNNDLQRIQDSDYYQKFSYSLKSEIPIQEWNDVVSNLNHTLGFKKFSDLIVSSLPEVSGIQTSQDGGSFSAICDLNSTVDIDCVQDYDLVLENSLYVENTLTSDEIIFNSVILQDYSESIGNKVLIIDDISDEFNTSVTRTFVTSFSI
jgi:hypothetical protein